MSRSLKKGPHVDTSVLAKVEKPGRRGHGEPIKTWARDCTIVPDFIGEHLPRPQRARQFIKRCS